MMEEPILRRLVYVKGLYRLGLGNLETGISINIAQAILNFDNCIEMLLKLVADYMQISLSKEPTFVQMLNAVNAKLTKDPLPSISLTELHTARNNIQHHGIIPDRNSAERYKELTEKILSKLSQMLGAEWELISLALLIKDDEARQLYQRAEKSFHANNLEDAAYALVAAFEYAKFIEQSRIYGSGLTVSRHFVQEAFKNIEKMESLLEHIDTIANEIEVLKLRLDYKKYLKYLEFSFVKFRPLDSPFEDIKDLSDVEKIYDVVRKACKQHITSFDEKDLRQGLIFLFDFVIDSMLRWEEVERKGFFELFSSLKETLVKISDKPLADINATEMNEKDESSLKKQE